ncbi:MAG TPA: histidine kinase [Steroidobacteraceae bacterium]|nr:histidine kinase [Steroidobacteraceae bacterium]
MPRVTDGAHVSTFAHDAFLPFDSKALPDRPVALQVLRTFAIWLAAWIFVGMMFMGQDVARRIFFNVPGLWMEVGFWTMRVVLSAALTLVVLWLGTVFPLEKRFWARRVSIHILFSLCFGVVRTGLEAVVYSHMTAGWGPSYEWTQSVGHTFKVLMIFGFHQALITYWFVLVVHTAVRYYDKFQERAQAALRLELNASELREQVTAAQLGALKMQLQPHFLFNTLNAIMGMVRTGEVQQAERALSRFSDLLRAVLDDMDAQEVTLERELTFLRLYLSIEQMRFSDRLVVRIEADPEVLDAAVPHMGLQPIAENAVRHGISRRIAGGSIDVRASRVGSRLHIAVRDSGAGARAGSPAGRGLGLSNLRARLKQLYGAEGELRIECTDSGAVVEVFVPYRRIVATPELAVSMDSVPR